MKIIKYQNIMKTLENMNKTFSELREFIEHLNKSNSTIEKKAILFCYKNNEIIKDILLYTYHPLWNYYVTSSNLDSKKILDNGISKSPVDLFGLLDDLKERRITGNYAIEYIWDFINRYKEYEREIKLILNRNLECRIDVKLINSVFKGLIPEFNVALANNYEDYQNKVDFKTQRWFCSRKLDGLRMITIIDDNGNINFYSRQGKEFYTMNELKEQLSGYEFKGIVLDGEVCIVDNNGNEDFKSIMKLYNKKNFTIQNPKYNIFDVITLETFEAGESSIDNCLSDRLFSLSFMINTPNIVVLEQKLIKDQQHFESLKQESIDKGWEGLILRRDTNYKGKRSNDLLKVKMFTDAEYQIIAYDIGEMRVIDRTTGVEKTELLLSNVKISHKGFEVSVGSGFTLEQRRYYKNNQMRIIGTLITVKYFQETKNQDGGISLRFPTVKVIHGEKREV